ncbi:MAG: hypothetical protein ACI4A5_05215 [Hominilimicola sp.]
MTMNKHLQNAKPILFNTEMVRAILDGRKTVTRRVIKPQPKDKIVYCLAGYRAGKWGYPAEDATYLGKKVKRAEQLTTEEENRYWTPPCHTGDILYVRETWCKYFGLEDDIVTPIHGTEQYYYRADGENPTAHNTFLVQKDGYDEYSDYPKWRPSIHMPKEAARIFLRITKVRTERLQDMTCLDMEKEGVIPRTVTGGEWQKWQNDYMKPIWDSTIPKKNRALYGWDANPWVWVIEFERLEVHE